LVALVMEGCAPTATPASQTPEQASLAASPSVPITTAVASTAVASTATSPSSAPAPAELVGTWRTELAPGDPVELRIHGTTYGTTHGAESAAAGKITVDDDEITFFGNNFCNGVGSYRWARSGDQLTFTSVSPDQCGGRNGIINHRTYTKSS